VGNDPILLCTVSDGIVDRGQGRAWGMSSGGEFWTCLASPISLVSSATKRSSFISMFNAMSVCVNDGGGGGGRRRTSCEKDQRAT
jgi:hypothetical protein